MVGRPVQLVVDKAPAQPARSSCDVEDLRVVDDNGVVLVDGVSFAVRGGEIYAIAGVQGNGQTELTEACVGLRPADRRHDRHRRARDHRPSTPTTSSTSASATCPRTGCTTGSSARSPSPRTWCSTCTTAAVRRRGLARPRRDPAQRRASGSTSSTSGTPTPVDAGRHAVRRQPAEGRARPGAVAAAAGCSSSRSPPAGSTSARWSSCTGGSSRERDSGTAVVLVSTELDEVLGLADRIAVMYRGRIAGEVPGRHASARRSAC